MRSKFLLLTAAFLPALCLVGCNKKATDTNVEVTNTTSVPADANSAAPADTNSTASADTSSAVPAPSGSYKVDRLNASKPAPTADFKGPNGEKVNFSQFAGKPFLIATWATQCQSCESQLANLDRIAAEGKIAVVALNINTEKVMHMPGPDPVGPYMATHKFKAMKDFRADDLSQISFAGASGVPATFLYDSQGHLVWNTWDGAVDFTSPEGRKLLAEAK